jgi:hypothetical protein
MASSGSSGMALSVIGVLNGNRDLRFLTISSAKHFRRKNQFANFARN